MSILRSGHCTQVWLVGVFWSPEQSHCLCVEWPPDQARATALSAGALSPKAGEEKLYLCFEDCRVSVWGC